MSTDKQAIIEKIQKLLALANSSNEHEAKSAAEKATALLTRYNLSMQDVEIKDRQYDAVHFMGKSSRLDMAHKHIFGILNTYFFIQTVQGRKFDYGQRKTRIVWSFFGERHNVEIAKYVFTFLDETYNKLYDAYRKETGSGGKTLRNSFYLGLTVGLHQQLRVVKKAAESEKGLVVVRDPGINEFINETLGKTKAVARRSTQVDSNAYNTGVEEGKKIRIAKGVEGGSTSSGRVLTGKR